MKTWQLSLLPHLGSGTILLAFCLTVVGCSRPKSNENLPTPSTSGKASSEIGLTQQTDPGKLPVIATGLQGRLQAVWQEDFKKLDPLHDGWDSEAFSRHALDRLEALGHWIIHEKTGGEDVLAKLLTDDFTCRPLVPDDLSEVFHDQQFSIRRLVQPPATESTENDYHGRDGWVKAVEKLIESLHGATDLHAHFKLYRVEIDDAKVVTRAYFQLSGKTSSGTIQQNATWRCRWMQQDAQSEPKLQAVVIEEFEQVVTQSPAGPLLADCTESVLGENASYRQQLLPGIDDWRGVIDWRFGIDIIGPHGLSVGDVNGDGLDDLYLCEPGGLPNRLYVQQPDGTAIDVSAEAGVDLLEPSSSSLLIDLDNDGDQDLVIVSGRFILFFENDGRGKFSRKSISSNVAMARSLTAVDYDSDGDLDIFVCGYFKTSDAVLVHVGLGFPLPYHDANNGGRNILLRNEGRWVFSNVTKQVGLDQNNQRFSFAAAWEDYDRDGDLDLYVANDFGRNNLYQNNAGRFVDVAASAGVEDISAGMSVSWGDFNRDGWPDLYVSNMFSSAGNRIAYQRKFKTGATQQTLDHYRRHARGNSLFKNMGDGTFRDVSQEAAVTMGRWAWGSLFVDVNNDGLQDLFVVNGLVTAPGDNGDL